MRNLFVFSLLFGYLSALTSTLFYWILWHNAYYQLMSFSFVMYTLGLLISYLFAIEQSVNVKLFIIFVFLNTISNLLDEVFYDATIIEVNDFIRLFTIIIITIKCKTYLK